MPPEKNDAFHGLQSIYLFLLDHESAGLLKKDISQYTTTPKIKMPNTKDKNFIEIPSSKKPSQCNRFFHNSFFRWPQQNPKKLILLVALTLAGVYEYKNKLRRLFL